MSSDPKRPVDPVPTPHHESPIEAAEAVVRRDVGYVRELLGFLGAILGGLRALWPQSKPRPKAAPPLERLEETAEQIVERVAPYPTND